MIDDEPRPPRLPTEPRRPRRETATVPIWTLGFVASLFAMVCLSLWAFIIVTRPTAPRPSSTAAFIVLTAPITPTFDPLAATITIAPPEPTATVPPNVNPGSINLGAFVQVAHTDGDPLKLRAGPTLNAEVNYLALPNEVFKVANGPTIADGFTWWYLADPADGTRNGWAVENYLEATTGP